MNFLTHFVVIIDKDSVTLLKEMTQHFHAVLQLACSQVKELMTWWKLTACETEWRWWSSCSTSSSITAQSASASSSFSKTKESNHWNWFIWDLVQDLCECMKKFSHCLQHLSAILLIHHMIETWCKCCHNLNMQFALRHAWWLHKREH